MNQINKYLGISRNLHAVLLDWPLGFAGGKVRRSSRAVIVAATREGERVTHYKKGPVLVWLILYWIKFQIV
jgi:hypothetical protein